MRNVIVKSKVNEGFLQELKQEVQTNKTLPIHIATWLQEIVREGETTLRGAYDPLKVSPKS